jgi:sucrose phosphorylase
MEVKMPLENKIMLVTYADSLGPNLNELRFAPLTYQRVDPAFGGWEDLDKIAADFDLMYDFMINHISRSSPYFQDFLKNKQNSLYYDLFIRYSDFWSNGGPTDQQLRQIYTRKPRPPFQEVEFADHTKEKVWCTFDHEQIDLDVPRRRRNGLLGEILLIWRKRRPR